LNWMVILPENSRCCVKKSSDFHNKRLSDGMEMHKGSKKVKKKSKIEIFKFKFINKR
jgi:hypothetical protein